MGWTRRCKASENATTFLAGLSGSNSQGGRSAVITGDIEHREGDLSSNGVVLHTHTHPENGDRTDAPS